MEIKRCSLKNKINSANLKQKNSCIREGNERLKWRKEEEKRKSK